jgi:hypothetical protein
MLIGVTAVGDVRNVLKLAQPIARVPVALYAAVVAIADQQEDFTALTLLGGAAYLDLAEPSAQGAWEPICTRRLA